MSGTSWRQPRYQTYDESQDDNRIVWNKTPAKTTTVTKSSSQGSVSNGYSGYARKIDQDAEEGTFVKKTYTDQFRQRLLTWRQQLGLTQKQFAQKYNLTESLIKSLENKTAVYDPAIVNKLNNLWNRHSKQMQSTATATATKQSNSK